MKKYQSSVQGFTLVELMVTVAVMVILGMMAAPALQSYLARAGMQTLQNDFTAALNLARSEAVSRNSCVSVCQLHKADGVVSCEVDDPGNWHRGWVVYENPSCVKLADSAANPPAGATILQVREAGSQRFTLTTPSALASDPELDFTFNARGALQADAATLELRDANDKLMSSPYQRQLRVSNQGRVLAVVLPPAVTTPTAAGGN